MNAKKNQLQDNPLLAAFNKMTAEDGWWNHIGACVRVGTQSSIGQKFDTIASGIFYKNASDYSTAYETHVNCHAFKGESSEVANKIIEEIQKKLKLNLVYERVYVSENFSRALLFNTKDNVLTFQLFPTASGLYSEIHAFSTDKKFINNVRDLAKEYFDFEPVNPDLFIATEDAEGKVVLQSIGKPGVPLLRSNYSKKVVEDFDYLIDQLSKKDPFGRLVILQGLPGSGKTFCLRAIISELKLKNVKYLYVNPEFLSRMSSITLTRLLLEASSNEHPIVLFIEDADECLVPRQGDNMAAISALLNLADGFIGNMLDIRVIATTNAAKVDIDEALKRPGRLCKIIEVDKLSTSQAQDIYKRLTDGKACEFTNPCVLADIYAKANEVDPNYQSKRSVGFVIRKDLDYNKMPIEDY